MELTVTIETTHKGQVIDFHTLATNLLNGAGVVTGKTATAGVEVNSNGNGKKVKVTEEQTTFDLGGDEEPSDETPNYTLTDLITGFKTYATENSREAAVKLLKKYGVKSVKDIPVTDYAKVMKTLNA